MDIQVFNEEKIFYKDIYDRETMRRITNKCWIAFLLITFLNVICEYASLNIILAIQVIMVLLNLLAFSGSILVTLTYLKKPRPENVEKEYIKFQKTYMEIHIEPEVEISFGGDKRLKKPKDFITRTKTYDDISYTTYVIPYHAIRKITHTIGRRSTGSKYHIYFRNDISDFSLIKEFFNEPLSLPCLFGREIWEEFEKINNRLREFEGEISFKKNRWGF